MERSWPVAQESIPEMCEYIYETAIDLGFLPKKAKQLELAVEEITLNIVQYGFEDGRRGEIGITLEKHPSKLILQVTDPGPPFNPLEAPEPNLRARIGERPVGGLGIFLARKMVDEMNYSRRDEKNVLTLVKYVN